MQKQKALSDAEMKTEKAFAKKGCKFHYPPCYCMKNMFLSTLFDFCNEKGLLTEQGHAGPVGEKGPAGEDGVDALKAIKAEVAREIFEEIEKSVALKMPAKITPIFKRDLDYSHGVIDGKRYASLEVLVLLAELKKKYTEGEPNG